MYRKYSRFSVVRAPEHELREQQVVRGGQQHVDEGQQARLELGGMRLLEPSARAVEVLRAAVQYTRSPSVCIRCSPCYMWLLWLQAVEGLKRLAVPLERCRQVRLYQPAVVAVYDRVLEPVFRATVKAALVKLCRMLLHESSDVGDGV